MNKGKILINCGVVFYAAAKLQSLIYIVLKSNFEFFDLIISFAISAPLCGIFAVLNILVPNKINNIKPKKIFRIIMVIISVIMLVFPIAVTYDVNIPNYLIISELGLAKVYLSFAVDLIKQGVLLSGFGCILTGIGQILCIRDK